MDRYGLIGYPLGHSYSAVYFNQKFSHEELNAIYELYPLPAGTDFRTWAASIPALKGFSVTIPYKQAILPFLDHLTPEAREIGAVNAVKVLNTPSGLNLIGHNTDWSGITAALEAIGYDKHAKALVLGTGGAARAAVYALRLLGIPSTMVSRKPGNEEVLSYEDIDQRTMASHHVIVNATPVGMFPDISACPPLSYAAATPDHLFFDMVYNPEETAFMRKAAAAGARVSNGYFMLISQAEQAWRWWQSE